MEERPRSLPPPIRTFRHPSRITRRLGGSGWPPPCSSCDDGRCVSSSRDCTSLAPLTEDKDEEKKNKKIQSIQSWMRICCTAVASRMRSEEVMRLMWTLPWMRR